MKAKKTILSADFPAKLRDLRKSRGWSQGQLAQKIGADLQRPGMNAVSFGRPWN